MSHLQNMSFDLCSTWSAMCGVPLDYQQHTFGHAEFAIIWTVLVAGWSMFGLSLCAMTRWFRKSIKTKLNEGPPSTAAHGLFLFTDPDFVNVIPPVSDDQQLFDLMWTEENAEKTISKEVFAVQSLVMADGRAMFIINGSEKVIFFNTPMSIPNVAEVLETRKDLFPTRPKKLSLVVIRWSKLVEETHE